MYLSIVLYILLPQTSPTVPWNENIIENKSDRASIHKIGIYIWKW